MNKKAVIRLKEKVSSKVWLLRLKMLEPETIEFKPGQFVSLKVGDAVRRSYSIGSSPLETEYIDLYNDITPAGPGSQYFLRVEEKDTAEFLGPLGLFTYKGDQGIPILFIATGTGIVPLYTMISHALKNEMTKQKIHLYFGARHEEDLFLHNELLGMAKDFDNFDMTLTLSQPDEKWKGEKGYVTDFIDKDFNSLEKYQAYICGAQAMISSAEELLLKKGMDADNIYYEKFY